MIDITGTSAQGGILLHALLWGLAIGLVCAMIKNFFCHGKIGLFVTDFIIATSCGISNIVFCQIYTKGVLWLYTLLGFYSGYALTYALTRKLCKRLTSKRKRIDI